MSALFGKAVLTSKVCVDALRQIWPPDLGHSRNRAVSGDPEGNEQRCAPRCVLPKLCCQGTLGITGDRAAAGPNGRASKCAGPWSRRLSSTPRQSCYRRALR